MIEYSTYTKDAQQSHCLSAAPTRLVTPTQNHFGLSYESQPWV